MSLSQYWKSKRAEAAHIANSGRVKFTVQGRRLQVLCPDRDEFTSRAKELGGKFKERSGVWTFPLVSRRLVMRLLVDSFPCSICDGAGTHPDRTIICIGCSGTGIATSKPAAS